MTDDRLTPILPPQGLDPPARPRRSGGAETKVPELLPATRADALAIAELRSRLDRLRQALNDLEEAGEAPPADAVEELRDNLNDAAFRVGELERILADLYASTSWRITAPARLLVRGARSVRRSPQAAKAALRPGAIWTMRAVLARPGTRTVARWVLARFPRIEARVRLVGVKAGLISAPNKPLTVDDLSPRAARLYRSILAAADKAG